MIKKKRKSRHDSRNHLGFDGSHMFGQPYNHDTPAARKLYKRLDAGLCLGCGEKECRCKSKYDQNDFNVRPTAGESLRKFRTA